MESENVDDGIELAWNKLERNSKIAGLREGISDGRDSTFQQYFDTGYREGFKAGFAIGKYVAALQFSSKGDLDKTEPLLDKPTRGWCEMCLDTPQKDTLSLSQIIGKQRDTVDRNAHTLFNKYEKKVDIIVPAYVNDTDS